MRKDMEKQKNSLNPYPDLKKNSQNLLRSYKKPHCKEELCIGSAVSKSFATDKKLTTLYNRTLRDKTMYDKLMYTPKF